MQKDLVSFDIKKESVYMKLLTIVIYLTCSDIGAYDVVLAQRAKAMND